MKAIVIAGLIGASLSMAPDAVSANAGPYANPGIDPMCSYHPYLAGCGYAYGGGSPPSIGPYRRPTRSYYQPLDNGLGNEPGSGISCSQAKQAVSHSGFTDVQAQRCSGTIGSFIGLKQGSLWIVRVDRRNGRITGVRPQ